MALGPKMPPSQGVSSFISKPILAFCASNFTFPQSYYIKQILTISIDCPVPIDKLNCVKIFYPTMLTPADQRYNILIAHN